MDIRNQLICAWSAMGFAAICLAGFLFANFIPPISPNLSAEEVAAIYRENALSMRFGGLALALPEAGETGSSTELERFCFLTASNRERFVKALLHLYEGGERMASGWCPSSAVLSITSAHQSFLYALPNKQQFLATKGIEGREKRRQWNGQADNRFGL